MGKKRTGEERRGYSKENSFHNDGTDFGDNPMLWDILDYTQWKM
jgi:hypothetical protein